MKKKAHSGDTYVYLIRDDETRLIKIGLSEDPTRRLIQLSRQSTLLPKPHNFDLIIAWRQPYTYEQELHRQFDHCRVRGEWFAILDEDVEMLLCDNVHLEIWCNGNEDEMWINRYGNFTYDIDLEMEYWD